MVPAQPVQEPTASSAPRPTTVPLPTLQLPTLCSCSCLTKVELCRILGQKRLFKLEGSYGVFILKPAGNSWFREQQQVAASLSLSLAMLRLRQERGEDSWLQQQPHSSSQPSPVIGESLSPPAAGTGSAYPLLKPRPGAQLRLQPLLQLRQPLAQEGDLCLRAVKAHLPLVLCHTERPGGAGWVLRPDQLASDG